MQSHQEQVSVALDKILLRIKIIDLSQKLSVISDGVFGGGNEEISLKRY